jgi:hypothetical protein
MFGKAPAILRGESRFGRARFRRGRRRGLDALGFQVFELAFELLDLPLDLLRLRPALHAPPLGNPRLQRFDLVGTRE